MKSVLILGPAYPFRGGLADFDHTLAREMEREGLSVRIFTFTTQYPGFFFPGSSQYTDAPPPEGLIISRELSSVNPFTWWRTGRRVQRARPDALIVRYWIPALAPALGTVCRLARRAGIPVMALLDNVVPHEHRIGDRRLTRYFVNSVDGFVYMSDQVLNDLRRFTPDKPALFSPHPMFTHYGNPMPKAEACAVLGLDPALQYTLFFGYIRDYKGLDLLYEAWALLKRQGKSAGRKLVVAGEYYGGRERYEALVEQLGIGEDVILFDRYIENAEVKYYFSAADLVVQPYRTATQSGVTQVAYWFGVPMVVTDVGGLREMVPDGEAGYVVEPDAEAVAGAIARFYQEDRADAFRRNILDVRKRFTWEGMIGKFRELFYRIQVGPEA